MATLNRLARRGAWVVIAALAPLLAAAQDRPAAPSPSSPAAAPVKLRVTALNRRNRLLLNLGKSDFRLFDDGRERRIETFSSGATEPLSLGILIDDSRDTLDEPDPPDWRMLADFVHNTVHAGDQAFVSKFDETLHFETAWTEDERTLAAALQRALAQPADKATAFYDAVYTTCQERFLGAPGRRVLLVVSDTPDNFSSRSELEALNMAERAGVIIYFILPWVRAEGEPIFRNAPNAGRFADQTGGLYLTVVRPRDLKASLAGIAALMDHYYVLGFRPPAAAARDTRFDSIKVTCARRGARIRYPHGYARPGP